MDRRQFIQTTCAAAGAPRLLPAGLIGPVRVVSEVKVASQGLASLLLGLRPGVGAGGDE